MSSAQSTGQALPVGTDRFLLAAFDRFAGRLQRLTDQAGGAGAGPARSAPASSPPDGAGPDASPPTSGAEAFQEILRRQLETEAAAATERFGQSFAATTFEEAMYAMAALADETFISLPWEGAEAWRSQPLVGQIFGPGSDPGSEVFRRIRDLLAAARPSRAGLAAVYLLVVAFGFEGRYRGRDDGAERLAQIRQTLLGLLEEEAPGLVATLTRLFPQAYEHTVSRQDQTLLPDLRLWTLILGLVVLVLVLISYPVWSSAVSEIRDLVHQILALE